MAACCVASYPRAPRRDAGDAVRPRAATAVQYTTVNNGGASYCRTGDAATVDTPSLFTQKKQCYLLHNRDPPPSHLKRRSTTRVIQQHQSDTHSPHLARPFSYVVPARAQHQRATARRAHQKELVPTAEKSLPASTPPRAVESERVAPPRRHAPSFLRRHAPFSSHASHLSAPFRDDISSSRCWQFPQPPHL